MAIISLFRISSLWDSPSFSPKPSLKPLFLLSSVTSSLSDVLSSSSVTDQDI